MQDSPPTKMRERRRGSRSTTMVDVALDAGVSPMTVSRVINGDLRVRKITRERVEQSIGKLNYSPNVSARNLAGARSARICLLYGNPSTVYLGELLVGALAAASELGHHILVERVEESISPETIYKDMRSTWDGLIVPPPISDIAGIRRLVMAERFPTVFLASATETGRSNEIRIDDYQAARELTELLIGWGHTRIAFIKGHPNQTVSDRRNAGYIDAMVAAGIQLDPELVAQGFFSYRSGMEAADRLLDAQRRPTAIFASNDDMAAGALAAAARRGLKVPDQLSIVGFDDSPLATTVWPNLTTVRQPVAEMAEMAVRMIHHQLSEIGFDEPPQALVLNHRLVSRDSVAPPFSGH